MKYKRILFFLQILRENTLSPSILTTLPVRIKLVKYTVNMSKIFIFLIIPQ